jgi:hypothetical protein
MSKRRGANSRKRSAERAGKGLRIAGILLVAALTLFPAIAGVQRLQRAGVLRIPPFATHMLHRTTSVVTGITVTGSGRVTAAQIMNRLTIRLPMPFAPVKKKILEQGACVSPWIAAVALSGPHDGILTVILTERKPIATGGAPGGYGIDSAGVHMPVDPHCLCRLPLVSGLHDSAGAEGWLLLTNEDRLRMNRFFHGLAGFDPQMLSRLTQVQFGPHGAATVWFEGSSTEIRLDGNNLENGLERLVTLLPSVRTDSGLPARIDLSCRNIAFVTAGETARDSSGKARQKG